MREALLERMPPMEVVRQSGDDNQPSYELDEIDQPNDSPVHQPDSSALLDLLGTGSDMDLIRPPETVPTLNNHTSNNQDLLDLLGGLDMNPTTPSMDTGMGLINNLTNNNSTIIFNNQNSNFLIDGISTQDNHSKCIS